MHTLDGSDQVNAPAMQSQLAETIFRRFSWVSLWNGKREFSWVEWSNFHFSTNEELKKGKGSLRRLPLKKLGANRICTRGAFSPILGPPNRETDRWPKFKSHPCPEPSRLWLHIDTWKRDGDGNLSPKRAYLNWPRETRSEEKKDVWVREQRPDRWNLNQKAG